AALRRRHGRRACTAWRSPLLSGELAGDGGDDDRSRDQVGQHQERLGRRGGGRDHVGHERQRGEHHGGADERAAGTPGESGQGDGHDHADQREERGQRAEPEDRDGRAADVEADPDHGGRRSDDRRGGAGGDGGEHAGAEERNGAGGGGGKSGHRGPPVSGDRPRAGLSPGLRTGSTPFDISGRDFQEAATRTRLCSPSERKAATSRPSSATAARSAREKRRSGVTTTTSASTVQVPATRPSTSTARSPATDSPRWASSTMRVRSS